MAHVELIWISSIGLEMLHLMENKYYLTFKVHIFISYTYEIWFCFKDILYTETFKRDIYLHNY